MGQRRIGIGKGTHSSDMPDAVLAERSRVSETGSMGDG